jgi:hypothetical protein
MLIEKDIQVLKDDFNYLMINSNHPHVCKKLELFWGEIEFTDMIYAMLNDTRSDTRSGFSTPIVYSLLSLVSLHEYTFPELKKKSTSDIDWSY